MTREFLIFKLVTITDCKLLVSINETQDFVVFNIIKSKYKYLSLSKYFFATFVSFYVNELTQINRGNAND